MGSNPTWGSSLFSLKRRESEPSQLVPSSIALYYLALFNVSCVYIQISCCVFFSGPAPGDYRAVSESISLSPTLSEACVDVEVEDDSAVESNECLTVSLSPLDGGLSVELSPNSTTVCITDNDGMYCRCIYMCIGLLSTL